MWYVIQTVTGREKELVEAVDRVLEGRGYSRCFVLQQECSWRIDGGYRIHTEPLFPSYVFVETETPEVFFYALKQVPKMTKLLGSDGMFWMVQEKERELLEQLIGNDKDYVVRRSRVQVNSDGEIVSAQGALRGFVGSIVKKRLRRRFVVIEVPFMGERRRIRLGIRLDEDEKILLSNSAK